MSERSPMRRSSNWVAGQSGNPAGRPVGTRSAFSREFVADLTATWREYGASVLQKVARSDPTRFLGIAASIVPKDVALTIEQQSPGNLDPADWGIITELLTAVRQAIPDVGDRKPGEVLQLTLDALRAHSARTIDGNSPGTADKGD